MKTSSLVGAMVLAATSLASGIASAAAPLDQLTVQASRIVNIKHSGTTSSGIPIDEISLSVRVMTDGLDLATSTGLHAMEKRIHAAADSACRELGRLYPFTETSNAECAIAAARPAIAKVREFASHTAAP